MAVLSGLGISRQAANTQDKQHLLHLQTWIEPDGSKARVVLHTTEGSYDLVVSIDQMASLTGELSSAGLLMFQRQLANRDRGRSALESLVENAPNPATANVTIDRQTSERIVVYRFRDRLPVVVRLSHDQVVDAMQELAAEVQRTAN